MATATVTCPHCFDNTLHVYAYISAGEPAHGPTYSCGGYPGAEPEIEDTEFERAECDCELSDADRWQAEADAYNVPLHEWDTGDDGI